MFRREWRQQVLVLALLSLAVAGAVFGATTAYNMTPSADAGFGAADRRIRLDGSDPAVMQADLETVRSWFGTVEVIGHRYLPVPGSVESVELRFQDPAGPLGAPMLARGGGRYPVADGEVAVTDAVAETFQVGVGDSFEIYAQVRTVVGLVENPADLDEEFVLMPPAPPAARDSLTILVKGEARAFDDGPRGALPSLSDSQRRGTTEKAAAAAITLALATVVMLLVCLVAAAGFVVVAHRRLRQLGMLAAIGATPRHLRLVVLANGIVVGGVAAVVGTAVALLAWVATGSRLEAAAGHRIDRFDVPWWLLATCVCLAVATSTVAAWWPARTAARVPITRALSGRPPRPRPARRSAVVAVVFLGAGFACLAVGNDAPADESNPLLVMAGTVAIVLGILFASPVAIRALAATAGRLPVAVRLALRDLARHQARSGAALAAISLGLAISTAIVVLATTTAPTPESGNLSDRQVLVRVGDAEPVIPDRSDDDLLRLGSEVDRWAASLPGATVLALQVAVSPSTGERRNGEAVNPVAILGRLVGADTVRDVGVLYVATPEVLAHVGRDPAQLSAETDVLTSQRGELYFANVADRTLATTPVSRIEPLEAPDYSSAPRSLITPAGIQRHGLEAAGAGWLVTTASPFTSAQLAEVRALAAGAGLTVEARRGQGGLGALRSGATAAGMLLALCILAMTVGLIRSEAGRDLRTLTAAGATSRARRTITATTAGGLALLAVTLGTAGAYIALVAGYLDDLDPLTRVPLLHLSVSAVGIPLAAAAAGWLLAGREPPFLARPALE
jgi:putative ABC transport system permease protein